MEWDLNLNLVVHSLKAVSRGDLYYKEIKKKLKYVQMHTKKYTERYKLYSWIKKDHLGDWSTEKRLLLVTDVLTRSGEAIYRVKWLWRWLSYKLGCRKLCQSPTTILLRTPVTQLIFLSQGKIVIIGMHEMHINFSVTMVKPETVSIYQVKKTEKDTYKKRTNWRLKDLKLIDGQDETSVSVLVYRTKNIIEISYQKIGYCKS